MKYEFKKTGLFKKIFLNTAKLSIAEPGILYSANM